MRHFENFIRNYNADDTIDRLTNLFEPREPRIGMLVQKEGEVIKFFTPKSDFGTTRLENLQVGLYGEAFDGCTSLGNQILKENIGFLRKQQSEFFYDMVIKVNNAPTADTWKQFALYRPNGQQLLGTFSSQQTDLDKYILELKDWLENYPHTLVNVYKDGNLLNIKIKENGNFRIRNEEITVGIGTVSVLNENSPTLVRQFINTYNRPAYNTSDLVIGGDVTEGNVYTLGTTVYTATKNDTAATVKTALLGDNSKVVINVGDSVPINAVVGTIRTVNTNNPTINLLYEDTLSGNDRYVVEVSNVQKGNIFQIARSGLSPLTKQAGDTDTKATIEAYFNATGGFLVVPTGTTLTESAVAGVRVDANTNSPTIGISNTVLTPAQMTDKYKMFVGTSVRKGNKFYLNDLVVTATEDDTYLTIAQKLNLIDGLYFEIVQNGVFDSYAERGSAYDEDNIADVQILSSPIMRRSLHYLFEAKMPTGFRNRPLQISVSEYYKDELGIFIFVKLLTVSNYFTIEENPQETVLLRCSDLGEVFGYQYFEQGINQQIRVPIYLKNDGYETTQVESQSVNNASVLGNIQMRRMYNFDIMAHPSWFHRAMQCWMRSRFVFLDEKKITLQTYETGEDRGAKKIQPANGTLYEDRYLMKNFGKLFLSEDNYKEKFSVITNFKSKIICIVLKNDLFCQEILEDGEVFIPVGEYKWRAWVGGAVGDTVDMQIYHNGTRIHYVTLFCGRWNKLESLIRVYPRDELLFEEMNEDRAAGITEIDTTLETTIPYDSVEYINEIGGDEELNGYVAPFVPQPLDTSGDWRTRVDENTDLSEERHTEEGDIWIVKSITT